MAGQDGAGTWEHQGEGWEQGQWVEGFLQPWAWKAAFPFLVCSLASAGAALTSCAFHR